MCSLPNTISRTVHEVFYEALSELAHHGENVPCWNVPSKLISKIIPRYGMVFEISVLQLYNDWKILSSSYFWRIVPFVRFFFYTKVEETSWTQPFSPQLTASRPGKLLTLSHRKHVWKCILDAIDKPFKPVFVAEDTKKEIAEQNRINVLIVSRENLV